MNRLTSKRCSGIKSGYWSPAKKEDLIQRLGPYEDIGLEPENILKRLRLTAGSSFWIPVTERLPEAMQPVLICRPYDQDTVKVEQGFREPGNWWKVYGTRVRSVTHWMPLPEPPKREERNGRRKPK